MPAIDTSQNIILTEYGAAKKQLAIQNKNNPIQLGYFAVGDANGLDNFTISENQEFLINEVWRGRIISLQNLEGEHEGIVNITTYIPYNECGSNYLKEYGIFDKDNKLIFVGKLNNYYKPAATSENAIPVIIQVKPVWGYRYGLSLYAASEYTYATKEDLLALDENAPTNKGAFIYFMSAPGRRVHGNMSATHSGSNIRIKHIYDELDVKDIVSGDYLVIHTPVTVKLPMLKNARLNIKRVYRDGEDTILTTYDTTVNKVDGEDVKIIDAYLTSLDLFCDGDNWFIG